MNNPLKNSRDEYPWESIRLPETILFGLLYIVVAIEEGVFELGVAIAVLWVGGIMLMGWTLP